MIDLLEEISKISERLDQIDKRVNRPYYSLNNGWGLTSLDSGQPFFVNTEDRNITPWIILAGKWETNVERVLMDYCRPGMTVLDIGAHFGYYTVKLGTRIGPTGVMMSFEPNPEVNAVCAENIKINGLSSFVHLNKIALGDAPAYATLTRSHSNMASANLLGEQAADYSVTVEVHRLDDVVPPALLIDLIKLDAEGYEKRILDGGRATLARKQECAIMIELGLERWEKSCELAELVPSCGGGKEVYAVHDDGSLEHFVAENLRPFLLTRPYHENYFLVAPKPQVEQFVGHLIRQKS